MLNENNKLITEFMGWTYIPEARYKNDLYEAGDQAGEWETSNIFVLNPSKEFLKQKKFGVFAAEDYYDNKKPYEDYKWSLKYHKDWNLLMSVIEKIESLRIKNYSIRVTIDTYKTRIGVTHFSSGSVWSTLNSKLEHPDLSKLELTYKSCVEFINWYNKNK